MNSCWAWKGVGHEVTWDMKCIVDPTVKTTNALN